MPRVPILPVSLFILLTLLVMGLTTMMACMMIILVGILMASSHAGEQMR